MRVAFYGNNLNQGYFFVKGLVELGIEAQLLLPNYSYAQESHGWWLNQAPDEGLIYRIRDRFNLGVEEPLIANPHIQSLYDHVRKFDLLIMMEDGPGVFSELNGVKKIFLSQGSDLQILPFLLRYHDAEPFSLRSRWRRKFDPEFRKRYELGAPYWERAQERQRLGIRQCSWMLCSPHQRSLARMLRFPMKNIRHLPIPMYSTYLGEVDQTESAKLESEYRDFDILFLHPTRQFYLRLSNDIYLKDNDKLIYGYARYLKDAKKKSLLILVEKGRTEDIEATKKLIQTLKIGSHVRWVPEIPNKELRSYLSLIKTIVCDQFSPNLATMGNIGRESAYYGAPLITAFKPYNRLVFGKDIPPHVEPAMTQRQIAKRMLKMEKLSVEEISVRRSIAHSWYARNCDYRSVLPRYIELFD